MVPRPPLETLPCRDLKVEGACAKDICPYVIQNWDGIIRIARYEHEYEMQRRSIDAFKEKIRKKKPFLHKIFPFKITIERR